MKVVAITGERECELVQRTDPRPAGDVVVVRNLIAPMCTEYKAYAAGRATDRLGHEAAGEVAEVAQPGRVKAGDRVVVMSRYPCGRCRLCLSGDYIHCQDGFDPLALTRSAAGNATYAQYVLKSDWLLLPVPNDMPLAHASMACCGLGPTFGAMQRMQVDAFDTLLITGMGPVGLGGVVNAVFRGARVIAVESHPYRARLAKELGAVAVVDPSGDNPLAEIMDLAQGEGVSAAIDCSGSAAAQRLLIDATRRRGRIAFVGEAGDLTLHVSSDLIRKGLTLYGQWHYSRADWPRMLQVISRSTELLDKMITHELPMSRVKDAFELQTTGECGKVLLRPWD